MLNTKVRPDQSDTPPQDQAEEEAGIRRRGLDARGVFERIGAAQARNAEEKEQEEKERRRKFGRAHDDTLNDYFNGQLHEPFRLFCLGLDFAYKQNFVIPKLVSGRNSDLLFAMFQDADIHKSILTNTASNSAIKIKPDAIVFDQASRANFSMDDAYEMALLAAHNKDMVGGQIKLTGNAQQKAMLQHALKQVNAILHPDTQIGFNEVPTFEQLNAPQYSLNAYLKKMKVKGLPEVQVVAPSIETQTQRHEPAPPPPRPQSPPVPPVQAQTRADRAPAQKADTREPHDTVFDASAREPRAQDDEAVKRMQRYLAAGDEAARKLDLSRGDVFVAPSGPSQIFPGDVLHDSVTDDDAVDDLETPSWLRRVPVFAVSDERAVLNDVGHDELELNIPLATKVEAQRKSEQERNAIQNAISEYVHGGKKIKNLGALFGKIELEMPTGINDETDTYVFDTYAANIDLHKNGAPPARVEYFYDKQEKKTTLLSVSSEGNYQPYFDEDLQGKIKVHKFLVAFKSYGPDPLDASAHFEAWKSDPAPPTDSLDADGFEFEPLQTRTPLPPIDGDFVAVTEPEQAAEIPDAVITETSNTKFKDRIKGLVDNARTGITNLLRRDKQDSADTANNPDAATKDGTTDDKVIKIARTTSGLLISGVVAWAAPGMNSSEAGNTHASLPSRGDLSQKMAAASAVDPKIKFMTPAELENILAAIAAAKPPITTSPTASDVPDLSSTLHMGDSVILAYANTPQAEYADIVLKSSSVKIGDLDTRLVNAFPAISKAWDACTDGKTPNLNSGHDSTVHKGYHFYKSEMARIERSKLTDNPQTDIRNQERISQHYFNKAIDLRADNPNWSSSPTTTEAKCIYRELQKLEGLDVDWEFPGQRGKAHFHVNVPRGRADPTPVTQVVAKEDDALLGAPKPAL